jgi:transcriptional regulator GlxA family with amidase domain
MAHRATAGRRSETVARFKDFLAANVDRPMRVAEVCSALGIAERTLRASCEKHLGMGPMRFILVQRLQRAHQALLLGEPSLTTVTEVATRYGFWELGRFARAYRTLFGETPSTTLRRSAT